MPYENGIPSHHTIGRVLGLLDPDALEEMFLRWMETVAKLVEGVVAIAERREAFTGPQGQRLF